MKYLVCLVALLAMVCAGCASIAEAHGGRSSLRLRLRSRGFSRQRVVVVPQRQRIIRERVYVPQRSIEFLDLDDGCYDDLGTSSLRLRFRSGY